MSLDDAFSACEVQTLSFSCDGPSRDLTRTTCVMPTSSIMTLVAHVSDQEMDVRFGEGHV
jgi:hypothetical protein